MPELPEVETIKRELSRKIKGKKIKAVELRLPKLINVSAAEFKKKTEGAVIREIDRRAKILIIKLSGGYNLLIHLKLTGQLIYSDQAKKRKSDQFKHTHIIFDFTDGSRLSYNDLRQFGYLKLADDQETAELLNKEKFGPEPLEKEFTLKIFRELLDKNKQKKIKPLLMDQTFLSGIGNIYANEICFFAKVRPDRKVSTLTEEERKDIYKGIKKILLEAVKYKGTSVDTYITTSGEKGDYEKRLKVYGRAGQKCPRCGGKLVRVALAGRGTFYCPKCQK